MSAPCNPVMYLFLNAGAGMSTGKAAAQAAHAAVEAFRISDSNSNAVRMWFAGKHQAKVVLLADDAMDLLIKQEYVRDRGFSTSLIIDEGRTEIDPFTPTAMGVEILDKNNPHVAATFGEFELYRDLTPEQPKRPWWRSIGVGQ